MSDCWLCCDECKRWRLVDPDALASLTAEKYKEVQMCAQDPDWKKYLEGASERQRAAEKKHEMRLMQERGVEERVTGQVGVAMGADGEELGAVVAPDLWAVDTAALRPDADRAGCADASEDEGEASSGSEAPSDPVEEEDYLEAKVRMSLEDVKRGVSTRHRGFDAKDAQELDA